MKSQYKKINFHIACDMSSSSLGTKFSVKAINCLLLIFANLVYFLTCWNVSQGLAIQVPKSVSWWAINERAVEIGRISVGGGCARAAGESECQWEKSKWGHPSIVHIQMRRAPPVFTFRCYKIKARVLSGSIGLPA
jgi:hypothetical protein